LSHRIIIKKFSNIPTYLMSIICGQLCDNHVTITDLKRLRKFSLVMLVFYFF